MYKTDTEVFACACEALYWLAADNGNVICYNRICQNIRSKIHIKHYYVSPFKEETYCFLLWNNKLLFIGAQMSWILYVPLIHVSSSQTNYGTPYIYYTY